MTKIVKELARHYKACILVFLLLIVQAYCDLSLPGYTSNIVDTGITQGGVESAALKSIREDTLTAMEMFMTKEAAAVVEAAYSEADADGIRTLDKKADKEQVSDSMVMPEMMLYMAATGSANGVDFNSMLSAGAGGMGGMSMDSQADGEDAVETVAPTEADLDAVVEMLLVLPEALLQSQGMDVSQMSEEQKEQAIGQTTEMLRGQLTAAIDGMTSAMDETTLAALLGRATQLGILEYKGQGIAGSVQTKYLLRVGLEMLGFTLLMVADTILVGFIASRLGSGIGRDLRERVFTRVVSFSAAETDQFSTASLITRTTNDIQQVQMVSVMMLRMVLYAPIMAAGGIYRVARSKAGLTWIIVVAVACLFAIIMSLLFIAMPKFKMMQTLVDRLNLVSREILTGIMPIRAFSREKHEEARFDVANSNLMKTQLFTNRTMAFMMPAMTMIMNGLSLAIVWFGGHKIADGSMQTGEMIAFITYSMQIVMSFLMLTMMSIMLPRAGVAADRIYEVLGTEPTVHDSTEPKPVTRKGVVRFDHVNFRYPGGEEDALHDIDFVAEPGKTTAIIGSTGCGKSTLLNLIPRFYDVTGGQLTIDGVDVRDIKQSDLREMLGYVPQKGVLFSGTIESNLKFGGDSITDDDMTKAARIAQATEFIEAKKDTYNEHIAQGGTNVSGGQKQRLSIARAIAKNPQIYLFDDSFSALDYKTDVVLRRALKEETGDATVLIVAQRISTVLHADQILVLDEGRIVGKGTHAELMETCPEYQDIARSQLSEKELNAGKNTAAETAEGKGGEQ